MHASNSQAPGLVGFKVSGLESGPLDWPRLLAAWTFAAESGAFDAGWMADHLTDASRERGGPAFESLTALAALAPHVPGLWVGVAVASNTFRHPAVLAKQATVLDAVTGGRFILGLGAGWHEGEHDALGIALPPVKERFDRFESAIGVLRALFSDAARRPPGVSLDDRFYPLRDATNEPPPLRPAGPPLWLGVSGPRGIRLLARHGDGWPMPGNRPGDVEYFAGKRDEILRAIEEADRDPSGFGFAGQLTLAGLGAEVGEARDAARRFVEAGATHVILTVPTRIAFDGLSKIATEVAPALRDLRG